MVAPGEAAMLTITNRTGSYYGDASSNHIWETLDNDGTVLAELYVSTERNEIMNVWVHEDHRGEGYARALYETASSQMDVFHAPVAHRTPEGNAFAEAVGGETVAPYACDCYTCDSLED
ncbi:GNAT family N-acetyltransferase [Streptomyces flavidovirens]|uniref:GNAT family N-acetyltransferase n=1 Tax=Streptomyces flavidovirens TaxID=67298 RepID=UPI0036A2D62D